MYARYNGTMGNSLWWLIGVAMIALRNKYVSFSLKGVRIFNPSCTSPCHFNIPRLNGCYAGDSSYFPWIGVSSKFPRFPFIINFVLA